MSANHATENTRRLVAELCATYGLTPDYDEKPTRVGFYYRHIQLDSIYIFYLPEFPDGISCSHDKMNMYNLQTEAGYTAALAAMRRQFDRNDLLRYAEFGVEDMLFELAQKLAARLPAVLRADYAVTENVSDGYFSWAQSQLALVEADTLAAPTVETLAALQGHFAELQK